MEARIVREELVKCQRGEGVNHYKRCGHLAEMYTGMIRENKVSLMCEMADVFQESRVEGQESERRGGLSCGGWQNQNLGACVASGRESENLTVRQGVH